MTTRSNYPGGFNSVTIRGVPITQLHPGRVFWVNNSAVLVENGVAGSDSGDDGTYTQPFASIDYAIGRCTANRSDIIVVMPGHSEDISGAAGIDADVDGINIIGLGLGDTQARVTFSHTTATLEVNADNVSIEGLWLQATVTGVLVGIDVIDGADDYRIFNNRFSAESLTTDEFIDTISVTTSDRGEIIENTIDMDQAGADSAIHLVGVCLGAKIRQNDIEGDYAVACIESIAAAQEHLFIRDNTLINGVHGGLNTLACINLFTGTTGFIQGNQLYTNVTGASTAAVVADSCFFGGGNFVTTTAETISLEVEGGASPLVRSAVATGKVDETDGLALFNVTGNVYIHGITQRAEVGANTASTLGVQVDATDDTLDSVLVTDTDVGTAETSVGDYAVSNAAGGAFTVIQVENTTASVMWDTPVLVPAGVIEQASAATAGNLVSGYIIYWSEATAGATCVAA